MNCIIHHTVIYTDNENNSTNSPEKKHQDGMDYIMSAFVIERNNVLGGKSKIYFEEKEHPLFTTTLQEGQGILQSDLGTTLWHDVSDISSHSTGFRFTLGLDFTLKK
ncbi:MAG: 2OG-Fe dioxygenase family protein [Ostreibacterium sp.]